MAEAPGVGGRRSVCRSSSEPDPETHSARKKKNFGPSGGCGPLGGGGSGGGRAGGREGTECCLPHESFARVLPSPSPGV